MSFLNSVLKAFVGDKRKKDLKLLQPLVDQVRSYDKSMEDLSIEELRQKTLDFKREIQEATEPFNKQIETLEQELETADIDRKEAIYREIDELKDESYKASEQVLDRIQPEAFAVIRETSRRFATNSTLL